jgi:hypothetical protein
MHLFVSYDLLRQGQDYATLIGELQRLGAKPVHLSLWSLRTTAFTGPALYEHLRRYPDANDRLLVITASSAFGTGLSHNG